MLFFHGCQNDLEGPLHYRRGGGLPLEFCFSRSEVGPEKKCTGNQFSGEADPAGQRGVAGIQAPFPP